MTLTSGWSSRSSRMWVTVWRRSSRGSSSDAGWRRDRASGRYVPTSSSRPPSGSASRSNTATLSESAQWRSSKTTRPTASAVSCRTSVDCDPDPFLRRPARVTDQGHQGCVVVGRRRRRSTSRNSSIGRPTVPGSAWPARTIVPAGARAISSWMSRVLPMPASPATRATVGTRPAPSRLVRRSSSADRPTMTGDSPLRPTSIPAAYGRSGAICASTLRPRPPANRRPAAPPPDQCAVEPRGKRDLPPAVRGDGGSGAGAASERRCPRGPVGARRPAGWRGSTGGRSWTDDAPLNHGGTSADLRIRCATCLRRPRCSAG